MEPLTCNSRSTSIRVTLLLLATSCKITLSSVVCSFVTIGAALFYSKAGQHNLKGIAGFFDCRLGCLSCVGIEYLSHACAIGFDQLQAEKYIGKVLVPANRHTHQNVIQFQTRHQAANGYKLDVVCINADQGAGTIGNSPGAPENSAMLPEWRLRDRLSCRCGVTHQRWRVVSDLVKLVK